jgi:hypothetical protein
VNTSLGSGHSSGSELEHEYDKGCKDIHEYDKGCKDIHSQIYSHGQFQTALYLNKLIIGTESQDASSASRKPPRIWIDLKDPSLYEKIKVLDRYVRIMP